MLWALIMAGGSGTRFWPESRLRNPKQFLTLFGPKALFEQALGRLHGVVPSSRIVVATSKHDAGKVRSLSKLPVSNILAEPVGRNTAPCAALAASLILARDPEAVLAILTADHGIQDGTKFQRALAQAAEVARESGRPVTFGVKPTFAHTGYGYLEMGEKWAPKGARHLRKPRSEEPGTFRIYRLRRFHEKPHLARARAYLKSKKFLWNSGMFVWRADELLRATKKYQPEIYKLAQTMSQGNLRTGLRRCYAKMPNISIDYGLMEKLQGRILAMPVDFGWSDLGSWRAMEDLWMKDKHKNAVKGKAVLVDCSGNIVKGDRRLIAMAGV